MNANDRLLSQPIDLTNEPRARPSRRINFSQDDTRPRGGQNINVIEKAREIRRNQYDKIRKRKNKEDIITIALVIVFGMYILYKQLL